MIQFNDRLIGNIDKPEESNSTPDLLKHFNAIMAGPASEVLKELEGLVDGLVYQKFVDFAVKYHLFPLQTNKFFIKMFNTCPDSLMCTFFKEEKEILERFVKELEENSKRERERSKGNKDNE